MKRAGYQGDLSAPKRIIADVLEQEPKNVRARWELYYTQLMALQDVPLTERADILAAVGKEIKELVDEARAQKREGLAHFMIAIYALLHNSFEHSLAEINLAMKEEPYNWEYRYFRGWILGEKGSWDGTEEVSLLGISILEEIRKVSQTAPIAFVPLDNIEFRMALIYSKLGKSHRAQAIQTYEGMRQRLIAEFGHARANKRYAEFCLEMRPNPGAPAGENPPQRQPAAAAPLSNLPSPTPPLPTR